MEISEKPSKSRKTLIISLVVVSLIIIAVIITLCVVLTKKHRKKTGEPVNNPIIFDFPNKRVNLNSGYYMPTSGIGTYLLSGQTCYNSVSSALKSGVRLIDSAYIYGNEEQVGRAEEIQEYQEMKYL